MIANLVLRGELYLVIIMDTMFNCFLYHLTGVNLKQEIQILPQPLLLLTYLHWYIPMPNVLQNSLPTMSSFPTLKYIKIGVCL